MKKMLAAFFIILLVGCSGTREAYKSYIEFTYPSISSPDTTFKRPVIFFTRPVDRRTGIPENYIGRFQDRSVELYTKDKLEDIIGVFLSKLIKSHGNQSIFIHRKDLEEKASNGVILETVINDFQISMRFSHGGFYP
ncbi:MAG: hypothetical protein JRI76_14055, partial [Deltaproteobacteria bacterium]|nr:hypothetical protein [Deltaproteobacteria bacterium]